MSPADWQLPPGVSRGLWDYLHDAELARNYDANLAGSPLLTADLRFAERYFDRPDWLIDLGCGTGRLLVPLAQRGFRVLGVDLSADMLRVVGEKAAAAGVTVHRLQANIVQLDGLRDGVFDYAACLFSTLGMVTGATERRQVIGHVHRLLRPGGRFVLHVHNRWFNFWDRAGRRWLLRDLLTLGMGDRPMPVHQGVAGLRAAPVHTPRGGSVAARSRLSRAGSAAGRLAPDGTLPRPWWFGWLRAYGYLIAVERPG